ncbi:MAG: hypothetical protein FWB85_06805, partial [Chitinispirillia bacterium]|nr:hypothetical protein [Chitinispirillia bacterium]MCL2241923.1 hypothetical protein [Chitinispirillia bacterium]
MTANKKDTGKVVRRIVLTGLLTTLIFTCDKIPEYCGDGHALDNPATQFCFGGETYTKCGGEVWRPDVQRCDEGGVLKTQCPGSDEFYNNVTEFCEDGKPHRRCGGEAYNTSAQVCVGSEVRTPCDGGRTVPAGQPCDGYILSTTAAPAEGGTVEPATQSYTP